MFLKLCFNKGLNTAVTVVRNCPYTHAQFSRIPAMRVSHSAIHDTARQTTCKCSSKSSLTADCYSVHVNPAKIVGLLGHHHLHKFFVVDLAITLAARSHICRWCNTILQIHANTKHIGQLSMVATRPCRKWVRCNYLQSHQT